MMNDAATEAIKIVALENQVRASSTADHVRALQEEIDSISTQDRKQRGFGHAVMQSVIADDNAHGKQTIIGTDDHGAPLNLLSVTLTPNELENVIYGVPSGLSGDARQKAIDDSIRKAYGLKPDATDDQLKQAGYAFWLDFVKTGLELPQNASNKDIIVAIAKDSHKMAPYKLDVAPQHADALMRSIDLDTPTRGVNFDRLLNYGAGNDNWALARLLGLKETATPEELWKAQERVWRAVN